MKTFTIAIHTPPEFLFFYIGSTGEQSTFMGRTDQEAQFYKQEV